MQLNRPGPHRRDITRLIAAASKVAARRRLKLLAEIDEAQTGTRYVSLMLDGEVPIGTEHEACEITQDVHGQPYAWLSASRVYRFASHAECYDTHDYSVWSGGGASSADPLPPGYDGRIADAIADVKRWIESHPLGIE